MGSIGIAIRNAISAFVIFGFSVLPIHHRDGLKCRLCGEIYISPTSESATWADYQDNYVQTKEQLSPLFTEKS